MAITTLTAHRQALTGHLQQHPYFAPLRPHQLAHLAEQATCHLFEAGEVIFLDGEACAGLWILGEGRAKVYKLNPEGSEHILHLLGPGDSFNDIAALDGGPNPASAATLSRVVACCLSQAVLRAAILADSELALTLIHLLSERTRSLVQQIEDLALYSVRARVARFLLKQGENPALSGPVITRTAIAAHLATQPETVSRALRSLEQAGIIAYDRQSIAILREDLLRVIAMN